MSLLAKVIMVLNVIVIAFIISRTEVKVKEQVVYTGWLYKNETIESFGPWLVEKMDAKLTELESEKKGK